MAYARQCVEDAITLQKEHGSLTDALQSFRKGQLVDVLRERGFTDRATLAAADAEFNRELNRRLGLRTNPRRNPGASLNWKNGSMWDISDPVRIQVDGVPADLHFEIGKSGGWGRLSAVLKIHDPNFSQTHPKARARLWEKFDGPAAQFDNYIHLSTLAYELEDADEAKREARVLMSEILALA